MRVAISYNFVKKVTDKLRFDQIPEANGEGSHIAIWGKGRETGLSLVCLGLAGTEQTRGQRAWKVSDNVKCKKYYYMDFYPNWEQKSLVGFQQSCDVI